MAQQPIQGEGATPDQVGWVFDGLRWHTVHLDPILTRLADSEDGGRRRPPTMPKSRNLRLAAVRRAAYGAALPACSILNLRPGSGGLRECAGLESGLPRVQAETPRRGQ
jgi:hypothetical protein